MISGALFEMFGGAGLPPQGHRVTEAIQDLPNQALYGRRNMRGKGVEGVLFPRVLVHPHTDLREAPTEELGKTEGPTHSHTDPGDFR